MMDGDYIFMYFDVGDRLDHPYYLRGHVSLDDAQKVIESKENIKVKSISHKYGRSIRVSENHEESIDGCTSIFRVINTPRKSYYKITECEPVKE